MQLGNGLITCFSEIKFGFVMLNTRRRPKSSAAWGFVGEVRTSYQKKPAFQKGFMT
jgi:hypothetical protein